jgi:glutathione S-transferase
VCDSWTIAAYLDDAYSDWPSLFGSDAGRAMTRFVSVWADGLVGSLAPMIAADILAHLHEKDRVYFRQTRDKRLGTPLEALAADRDTTVLAFRKSLDPIRTVLAAQPYLGGLTPAYADYAVFGCFQWARCVSPFALLLGDDPVWSWRARLLAAFDGFAGSAIGYPV